VGAPATGEANIKMCDSHKINWWEIGCWKNRLLGGCAHGVNLPTGAAPPTFRPPPPPSRTNWTRPVPPSRTNWTRLVPPQTCPPERPDGESVCVRAVRVSRGRLGGRQGGGHGAPAGRGSGQAFEPLDQGLRKSL
jgi:hypothetical protein